MSREPGEAGSAHSGWDGEEGVHADTSDRRDRRGLGWGGGGELGLSWGPRQLVGPDQGGAGMDSPNCMSGLRGEGGRTLLCP